MFQLIISVLLFISAPLASAQPTPTLLEINLETIKVNLVVGDLVGQNTEALVLAHEPDLVRDVGINVVADSGGKSALDEFRAVMKDSPEPLPYSGVYATRFEPGGRIIAQTLLNAIELRPIRRLHFLTEEQLEWSAFPLPDEEKEAYRKLLAEYRSDLDQYSAKLAEEKAKYKRNEVPYSDVAKIIWAGPGREFEHKRNLILENLRVPVAFETVTQSTIHLLQKASELGIHSLSTMIVGPGIRSELDLPEAVAAIATGAKLFSFLNPNSGVGELRIVINTEDTTYVRNYIEAKIRPVFNDGHFLVIAEEQGFHPTGVTFESLRLNYMIHDFPSLKIGKRANLMQRFWRRCQQLLLE